MAMAREVTLQWRKARVRLENSNKLSKLAPPISRLPICSQILDGPAQQHDAESHLFGLLHDISISKPLRISRERNELAFSSPMISRFAGSQFSSRPKRMAMFAK